MLLMKLMTMKMKIRPNKVLKGNMKKISRLCSSFLLIQTLHHYTRVQIKVL